MVGVKRLDCVLRTLMARRPNASHSVPVSPLFAENSSPNCFLNAQTLSSSSLLSQIKNLPTPTVSEDFLVGVKRLELPTSWSQTRRATNCATPRCNIKLFFKSDINSARYQLSVRNIVASLAWSASRCSVFLPAQALPSSATGGGNS